MTRDSNVLIHDDMPLGCYRVRRVGLQAGTFHWAGAMESSLFIQNSEIGHVWTSSDTLWACMAKRRIVNRRRGGKTQSREPEPGRTVDKFQRPARRALRCVDTGGTVRDTDPSCLVSRCGVGDLDQAHRVQHRFQALHARAALAFPLHSLISTASRILC